jgi:hypothetical protein
VAFAEELKESTATFRGLFRSSLTRSHVSEIDVDHVGDRNLAYVSFAASRRVLAGDVLGERRFSLSTFAHAAASALLVSGVFDDPDCALGALVLSLAGWPEPQIRASGVTRHRPNILCTSATEVQSLPATLEITSRPRLASVRNAAAVSPNCAATTPRRCGASLSTAKRRWLTLMKITLH